MPVAYTSDYLLTEDSEMTEIQAYFHSLFSYDEETGFLYWKERPPTCKENNIFNSRFKNKKVGSVKLGEKSKTPYLTTKVGKKYYAVHRVIFAMCYGYFPEQVDHIDHNGLNNKLDNLRPSSNKDNSKNLPMQKSNKSGHIGVNWHKAAKKWQARAVDLNGKRIDLGRYDNIEDAISVRKKYEKEFKYYQHRDEVQC